MAIRLVALSELARDFTRKNQLLLVPTAWIQQLRPVSIPFLPSIRSVHIQTTACSEKRKLWDNFTTLGLKNLLDFDVRINLFQNALPPGHIILRSMHCIHDLKAHHRQTGRAQPLN